MKLPGSRHGYVYIASHRAWEKIGMIKIGMTARNPRYRVREITSSSGLLTPGKLEWCMWVEDCREVEKVVHRMLDRHRVSIHREFFRCSVDTAREAIERASCLKAEMAVDQPKLRASFPPPHIRPKWRPFQRRRDSQSLVLLSFACAALIAAIFWW